MWDLENSMADDDLWYRYEHPPEESEPWDDDYDAARDLWDEEHDDYEH